MYNPKEYWEAQGKNYKYHEKQDELFNLEECIHKYLIPRRKDWLLERINA